MFILINDNGEIVAYADYGSVEGSIEFRGSVPDDFKSDFKPKFYLLQDDQIIANPDYQEPTVSVPEPQPSEADKQVAQLTYQQMMTTQDVTTLQTQNAQMAYQLMMIQQGGEA